MCNFLAKELDFALCAAAAWGHLEAVRILLAAGADPDDDGTGIPLAFAAKDADVKITRTLLEAGARAYEMALRWGPPPQILKMLRDPPARTYAHLPSRLDRLLGKDLLAEDDGKRDEPRWRYRAHGRQENDK